MKCRNSFLALCAVLAATANSQAFDLGNYHLVQTYNLPAGPAGEASAVTYNWDTGTLFVLGDEGDALLEITTNGTTVSTMTLTGFADTEGLTYLGSGLFGIVEERLQDVYRLTYSAGGTADRSSLLSVSFGETLGNIGLEGITYEPSTGLYWGVKEKTPQAIYLGSNLNFSAGTVTVVTNPFVPSFGVLDLSDVEVLSKVPSLVGTSDQDNLLIFSQESGRLLEVDRTNGNVLSFFDLTGVADAEGVTIGPDGTIYIVGETPRLYVLAVPEPSTAVLFLAALGIGGVCLRRKR